MTTIKEIAQKTGYSSATVSRILTNDPSFNVSEQTRNKVMLVAQKLGYAKIITGHHYRVGVVFSVDPKREMADAYFSGLRESILKAAESENIEIIFYESVGNVPREVDGFLAVGYFSQVDVKKFREIDQPVVFIESNPDSEVFDSVETNFKAITEKAINLFISAGFKSIGFIGGQFWNQTFPVDSRRMYFENYMRELGIFDNRLVFIGNDFTVEDGYKLGMTMLSALGVHYLPDGILIGSDTLAVGVLQALNENRILIPTNTAIISINDIEMARYVSPPLTTFHIDINKLGKRAIRMLKYVLEVPDDTKETVLLSAKPIFRKSFQLTDH